MDYENFKEQFVENVKEKLYEQETEVDITVNTVKAISDGFIYQPQIDVASLTDYDQMKDKLVMEVVSAETNKESDEIPDDAERKGLGTPATRAGVIEKLVRIGFLKRRGDKKTKYLVPTHKGETLITVIPESIQSASMTADWEQKLLEIEKGSYDADAFMIEISQMIKSLLDTYRIVPDAEVLMHPVYKPLGKCPHCGSYVVEKPKGFFCENKDCKFALWKDNRFFDSLSKKITKQIAVLAKMKKLICRAIF